MPASSTITPIIYFPTADARFFEHLWRNASPAEHAQFADLYALQNAQRTHSTSVFSTPTVHTADVCHRLAQLNVPTTTGCAPLLAAQSGIACALDDITRAQPATWLRLSPVYWAAARDHVNLHALDGDTMDVADWAQIVASVLPWLHELGWEVFAQKTDALIRIPCGFEVFAPSLALAQSDQLEVFLPHGADLARWQTLSTELQMLLFTHPVNAARAQRGAPPINSIWLDQTARAESFTPELLNAWTRSASSVARIDFNSRLTDVAQRLAPVIAQLRARAPASVILLTDAPDATAHTVQFTPRSAWVNLRQKWQAKIHNAPAASHPFDWLNQVLPKDTP